MNATFNLNGLTFNRSKSGDAGSEYREVSRGVNLPEILGIKHSEYTDGKYKIPGVRTNVRLDRYVAAADGRVVPVVISLTVAIPSDVNIVSADVTECCARVVNLIHGTTNTLGLGLASNIFINKEQ